MWTNGEKINNPGKGLRILVAPLDWGLGHATRCVPIIYALLNAGAEVFLAGEEATEAVLKKEFPTLPFLPLKGYNIRYSNHKWSFFIKLLSQFPNIKRTITYEHNWLKKVVKDHNISAVISDNRFGFYHPGVPSVYITHQLHIETGNNWINRIAQKIHYSYINQFTECWVPDVKDGKDLAGKLSHPAKLPGLPVKYLGIISRFTKQKSEKTYTLIVVLSGPEPQRTIFENLILEQLKNYQQPVILVRGKPSQSEVLSVPENVVVHNHLPAIELSQMIQQCEMVLARAGYSTVMDLAALQQKAILVATPGQAEQEYLATYLKEKKVFYSCPQQNINLERALLDAQTFYASEMFLFTPLDKTIIENWLAELAKAKALL